MRTLRSPHLGCLLAAACAGCSGPQSVLQAEGPQAAQLLRLFWLFTVVLAFVWIVVMLVLAATLRRRAAPGNLERGQRRSAIVVTGAVVGTVLIISALTFMSYATTRPIAAAGEDSLVIKVRGYQWWWEVTYTDPQVDRTFITANEIHVPTGRPIRLELSAADVIHSFWVPNLAGKQDLIPGRDNTLHFTIWQAGVYRGQCAEFCGLQHAHMAFAVIAEPPAAFDAWRAAQVDPATEPGNAEQARGRTYFTSHACAACHTVRGTSAAGTLGPDLTHVASRRGIAAGMMPTTRGSLAAWIADPQTIKPGNNMPMVPMTPGDLRAVSAWLAALK
jgi:cytochrome c oxidase subunit II